MKLYRRHIASGAVDNIADYPNGEPFEAGDGFEWVEGDPPTDALPHKEPTLAEQLQADFETDLSPEQQADLAPLKAAVKLELDQDRTAIARLIIERAVIAPELEPVRQALLSRFDA